MGSHTLGQGKFLLENRCCRCAFTNGSIFAAHKTVEIALALNLEPCFTPVESPESNGMAEAFVKTFKRDYVRVAALPHADTALALQHRSPSLPPGLPFTPRVHRHPIATRRVPGLTGSTPVNREKSLPRPGLIRAQSLYGSVPNGRCAVD